MTTWGRFESQPVPAVDEARSSGIGGFFAGAGKLRRLDC